MSCPNCFTGSKLTGEPTGSLTELDGFTAYVASSPNSTGDTQRAVVLFMDAFGLTLINSKLIADNLANALSCDVWVPDIFNGEPIIHADAMRMSTRAGDPRFMEYLRVFVTLLPRIGILYRNRPTAIYVRVTDFLKRLREQKKYSKIGAVGYCYGGGVAARLGTSKLLDSIVVCHPSMINIKHIKAIDIPASWVCAEEDPSFAPAFRNEAEAEFAARKDKENFVDYEFVVYKGTAHGFACRPNLEWPEVKEGYEKGFEQTVKWFDRTL
ncbi:Alpha/Beta hydrolase protein [Hygrophoropsis aurantiaca]|uniref:Alpha/Beta hydrolase protein n=1 Tax=Hygrophoropsis aurantiaca TaxID=72124 RepID=A0ACB8A8W2_9AGAM|nr:Alpha/Beta hydrolase protein [Hygrophoropsis aurantiaca]